MTDFLKGALAQFDSDMTKVASVAKQIRKRFFSRCATCGDTGTVQTAKGASRCTCPAGAVETKGELKP